MRASRAQPKQEATEVVRKDNPGLVEEPPYQIRPTGSRKGLGAGFSRFWHMALRRIKLLGLPLFAYTCDPH